MKKFALLKIVLFVLASVLLGLGVFDRMKISKVLFTESIYLHEKKIDWEIYSYWNFPSVLRRPEMVHVPGEIENCFAGRADAELARLGVNLHGRLCSLDRMRRIRKAMQEYEKEHGEPVPLYSRDERGVPLHSWRVLLLPYLAKMDTGASRVPYDQIRLDEPWDSEWNSQFRNRVPEVYRGGRASGDATGYSLLKPEESDHSSWLIERNDFVEWMDPKGDVSVDEILDSSFLTKARENPGWQSCKQRTFIRHELEAELYDENSEKFRSLEDFPDDKTFWLTTPTREYCVSPDCDGQKIIEALFQNPVE